MELVSVIVPVYNVEKYLRRCLDSVLNQTCPDWEAVCVNVMNMQSRMDV